MTSFKVLIFTLVVYPLFASPSWGLSEFYDFKVDPDHFYTHNDQAFLFSVKLKKNNKLSAEEMTLLLLDEERTPLKFLGFLNDIGKLGDKFAGDGIFSRKVYFKERKPKVLRFGIASKDWKEGEPASELHQTQIEVLHRPSFVQRMNEIWTKVSKN